MEILKIMNESDKYPSKKSHNHSRKKKNIKINQILSVCIFGFILTSLPACQKTDNTKQNTIEINTTQPEISTLESETNSELEPDLYVGEYNDYEINEPNLEIQKNNDGTYTIQICIIRLVYMDDGIGNATDNGIEFSATAPNGNKINGMITLEDDIATVTFTSSEWSIYSNINKYQYYKTSDIPNIYVPEY